MPKSPLEELRELVQAEADQMTSVATGGPPIDTVKAVYRKRRARIANLCKQLRFDDPNPHGDLWDWYGRWSSGDLPTYQSRREYVRGLLKPLLDAIDGMGTQLGSDLSGADLAGWELVESQIGRLRTRLAACDGPEDSQAVGLLCRDILVSLADAAYDPANHGPAGNSAVDRLNVVIDAAGAGSTNAGLRKLLKATVDFTNKVQHQRTATPRKAGICAEATVAAVHLVRRLTRDDPSPLEGEPATDLSWPPTPPPPQDDDVPF